jgi:hypothetical protein
MTEARTEIERCQCQSITVEVEKRHLVVANWQGYPFAQGGKTGLFSGVLSSVVTEAFLKNRFTYVFAEVFNEVNVLPPDANDVR